MTHWRLEVILSTVRLLRGQGVPWDHIMENEIEYLSQNEVF